MQWQWLTGPAIGAIIGYITNDIAVRMLFRPLTQKTLFGVRLPFTPGLIPKERPRLARAIRDTLDSDLLNEEVLREALLSAEMLEKMRRMADDVMRSLLKEERTPRALLEGYIGQEAFSEMEANAKRSAAFFLMEKILESGVEQSISIVVIEEVRKRMKGSAAAPLSLLLDEKRGASIGDKLSRTLREMIATHAPEMIDSMIEDALRENLDVPLGELLSRHADKADSIHAFLMEQYTRMIQTSLSGVLKALDLGAIVEEKLNAISVQELEALIMQVMRQELRVIVRLGALLGGILGLVNALL